MSQNHAASKSDPDFSSILESVEQVPTDSFSADLDFQGLAISDALVERASRLGACRIMLDPMPKCDRCSVLIFDDQVWMRTSDKGGISRHEACFRDGIPSDWNRGLWTCPDISCLLGAEEDDDDEAMPRATQNRRCLHSDITIRGAEPFWSHITANSCRNWDENTTSLGDMCDKLEREEDLAPVIVRKGHVRVIRLKPVFDLCDDPSEASFEDDGPASDEEEEVTSRVQTDCDRETSMGYA